MDKKFYHEQSLSSVYDIQDKEVNAYNHIKYTLLRTQQMFRWNNLPDTIPQKFLETFLQCGGYCFITKSPDGELCVYQGGLGGMPDYLYRPTQFIVANPYQKFNKTLEIDKDGILVKNDFYMMGLLPMIKKYSVLLAENELSIWDAEINTRIIAILTASDGKTKTAADEYIKKIVAGDLSAVFDSGFGGEENLRTQPYATTGSSNAITQLIELEQYLKGSLYNDLGLQSNWNAKRESISSNESQLNEDMLMPLIDEMLSSRKEACDQINAMFGTDISVELNSTWEDNQEQIDAELEAIEEGDVTSYESSMEDVEDKVEDEVEDKEDDKNEED